MWLAPAGSGHPPVRATSSAAAASPNRGVVFVFDPRAPAAGRAAQASVGGAGRALRRKKEREPSETGRRHGTGPGAPASSPPALRLQPPFCAAARREGAFRRSSCRGPVACHQPDGHHESAAGPGQVRRDRRGVPQASDLQTVLGVIGPGEGPDLFTVRGRSRLAGARHVHPPPRRNVGRERPFAPSRCGGGPGPSPSPPLSDCPAPYSSVPVPGSSLESTRTGEKQAL